jgi:integrase
VVVVAGKEVKHNTGYYELRFYEGDKPKYEALRDVTPTAAEVKRKRKADELSARVIAKKAGIQVVPADPRRKTMPEIYTDKELQGLFEAIKTPRENLLYRVLVQTGLREQEAMHLEWADISPDRKLLKLQSKVKRWGVPAQRLRGARASA